MSQKTAAIFLGVRPPSISDWESDKTKPNHEHLVAMATLYGTTTDYLTGASDINEKQRDGFAAFPERIRAIRKSIKLTQEQLGEIAGVSQRCVASWESGDRMPSHAVLANLADRFGVSVDYILGRSNENVVIKKQPAATRRELIKDIISQIKDLDDPALYRVSDFLSGLKAGQETAFTEITIHSPAEKSAE